MLPPTRAKLLLVWVCVAAAGRWVAVGGANGEEKSPPSSSKANPLIPQVAASPAVAPAAPANLKPILQALGPIGQAATANSNLQPSGRFANVRPQPGAAAANAGQQQTSLAAKAEKFSPSAAQETSAAKYLTSVKLEDPVTYLDYSSIGDEVLRKRTANFVYFNADFNHCRHCYKFYAAWKELAVDIRWWWQVIRLFTINCSDEDNVDTCRRAGVTQFPQVKFYWIMSQSLDQDGQRLRVLGKSVHAMRHLIMDKVVDSYTEHNKLFAQRQRGSKGSPPAANPLAALTPLLSQLMPAASASGGGGGGGGGGASSGSPAQTAGGLSSLFGALAGGGGKSVGPSGGAATSAANPMSLLSGLGGGVQNIGQMINALASVASMRRSLSIQPLPNNWPELEQLVAGDAQRLLDLLPLDASRNVGALLIMETQEFLYTGLEVMLDLSPYSNQTYIARVRDERSQLSKNLTRRDDVQAPALIYVTESREPRLLMAAPKYTNDEDLRRLFVRSFERKQIKYPVRRIWSSASGATQLESQQITDSQENEEILARVHKVHMNDLTNAIRASLMDQVFRQPDLSDDQYNALVKYVYALINYFPFQSDESLKFLKRLHAWLQNQVSPMDVNEYKKQFHDVDEVLAKREWVACKALSNPKAIPGKNRKSGALFENPAQFGKIVSNITRLFRTSQQKVGQLKSLLGMFSGSSQSPVLLSNTNGNNNLQPGARLARLTAGNSTGGAPTQSPADKRDASGEESMSATSAPATPAPKKTTKDESPIERLLKSLTSGSLGSDSSILRLISSALTGGGGGENGNDPASASGAKSKFSREYPCGVWKLAHVLVVSEYTRDSPRKDVRHLVLLSLYQYMRHFYACATCGNRVSDVAGEFRLNLDDHLTSEQSDSIMLLWKVHNRVSKRLESELRPGSPAKQQFPGESLCPKCRAPRAATDLVASPNWHEKQVLNFLVHHYRAQSIISNDDEPAAGSSSSSSASSVASQLVVVTSLQLETLWRRHWLTLGVLAHQLAAVVRGAQTIVMRQTGAQMRALNST